MLASRMNYLRIRACYYCVVVFMTLQQRYCRWDSCVLIVALVTTPMPYPVRSFTFVPYPYIYSMPTGSVAWIRVQSVHDNILVRCYCTIMCAEDAWIWINRLSRVKCTFCNSDVTSLGLNSFRTFSVSYFKAHIVDTAFVIGMNRIPLVTCVPITKIPSPQE